MVSRQTAQQAKARLSHKDIIGSTCEGRQGLGTTKLTQRANADSRQQREMLQKEVRETEEEDRRAKAEQLGIQGAWTRWTVPDKKLTWSDIWQYDLLRQSFLLISVYDFFLGQLIFTDGA